MSLRKKKKTGDIDPIRCLVFQVRTLGRQEWWRRPLLALLFLGFSYWAADRVLTIHPAPQDRPPKIVALPPAREMHSSRNGYVISVSLNVNSCSAPVTGSITVVLPSNFFKVEESPWSLPPPRKALFGVAFSDPQVEVTHIAPAEWRSESDRSLKSWAWTFSDPTHADAEGLVSEARIDDWDRNPEQLEVEFEAPWLRSRGYGSCWLPTPELVGDLLTFTVNASENVDVSLGKSSGADPLHLGHFSSGSQIVFHYNDGRVRKTKSHTAYQNEYSSFDTPPSLGSVVLNSPMSILPSESLGPAPSTGRPSWTCVAGQGSPLTESHWLGLGQDGEFRWNEEADLKEYEPATTATRCDGWFALVEPGSQPRRDLWLLVIGATLSAGVALLVDAALMERSKRRRRHR